MISETFIFFCGLFVVVLVGTFFTLSGLELRRLGKRAEDRRLGRPGSDAPLGEVRS